LMTPDVRNFVLNSTASHRERQGSLSGENLENFAPTSDQWD
jgi:hypothetical protein